MVVEATTVNQSREATKKNKKREHECGIEEKKTEQIEVGK